MPRRAGGNGVRPPPVIASGSLDRESLPRRTAAPGRPGSGRETRRPPRPAGQPAEAARSRSRAVTALPSAWPLVAFMTRPTKKPVSLPRALSSPST